MILFKILLFGGGLLGGGSGATFDWWFWLLYRSPMSDPSSLNLSTDSMDVQAAVAGPSRSTSRSSSSFGGIPLNRRVRTMAIKDSQGRSVVPIARGQASSSVDHGVGAIPANGQGQGGDVHNVTQELHLRDKRSVHVGVSPQEFGAVVAEAQRLLSDFQQRANSMEASAREIYSQACVQVQHLKTMVESLHQTCFQQSGSLQQLENEIEQARSQLREQISINESQRSQIENLSSRIGGYEKCLADRDSEITRLMGLASQLPERDVMITRLSQRCETVEARLAAASAAREEGLPDQTEASHEIVGHGHPSSNSDDRVLDAIQSLSSQIMSMNERISVIVIEQGNGAGTPSLPDPGSLDFRVPVVRENVGNDEGSDDGEEELVQDNSPTHEKEIVDSRSLRNAKLEPVPNTAADFRAWKSSLILLLGRLDISGTDYLTSWITVSFGVNAESDCKDSSGMVPRLDRWLASELIRGLKGVPELQFKVQGYIESCARSGSAPRGRAVLNMISRHFDVDRVRGSLLTSEFFFQIELNGFAISDFQEFSSQVMRVLNSIPRHEWPSQRMMGEFLFHKLRTVRRLERVIDEVKRSSESSSMRDFDYLWTRLQEFLVEEREDVNAKSIEQSLKSPKKQTPNIPKPKTTAAAAKAAPSESSTANAAPANPKAFPKKTEVKGPPKAKAKAQGRPLTAEEKAKTPCIFHQLPSGCVHGDKCAYSHTAKSAPQSPPKAKHGGAKSEPKAKAKAAPAAAAKTLATVAILAATMLQPSQAGMIEWAADSGAGRHLTSFEALSEQGYDRTFFDGFSNQSQESLRFCTGGGQKSSSLSIGFQDRDGLFGNANHFLLESCPMVRSVGIDVEENGLGFVWLPGSKPFYLRNPSECQISCSEDNKFYASKVSQNVPFFQSHFNVVPGVPAEVGDFEVVTPPEILEPSVEAVVEPDLDPGERSSVAAEVREVAPDEALPRLPESTIAAREDAVSIQHRLNHFPKNPLCDVCNRAKLFSKRIKSRRVPDPESDLPDASSFGEQIAIDHMVVTKSSGGREFLVLIVYDSFSGIVNAYPTRTKSSEFVYQCLRHFVGLRYKNPDTVCRSDAAPELVKAIRELGWLPETALPRRWPHNSKCERQIRAFEESCRCLHLQAGFAVMPGLWPVTCRYAAISMNIDKWEEAFKTDFKGASYALGQLVFYRTKFEDKHKMAPNAFPALMAGWKLEFGMRYKGVLNVLDYICCLERWEDFACSRPRS